MIAQPAILDRVIEPERGEFSPDLARYILKLDFPGPDHTRYLELSDKAQEGSLSPQEQLELDDYLSVNAFLMMIQSKARVSLQKHGSKP